MLNFKSSGWLACAALILALVAPESRAAGMAPTGNFVSVRVAGSHAVYGVILSPTKILIPAHVLLRGRVAGDLLQAGEDEDRRQAGATEEGKDVVHGGDSLFEVAGGRAHDLLIQVGAIDVPCPAP